MDRSMRGVVAMLVTGGLCAVMGIALDKISLVMIGCTVIIFAGFSEVAAAIRRAGEGE